jgi:hypothetical protein
MIKFTVHILLLLAIFSSSASTKITAYAQGTEKTNSNKTSEESTSTYNQLTLNLSDPEYLDAIPLSPARIGFPIALNDGSFIVVSINQNDQNLTKSHLLDIDNASIDTVWRIKNNKEFNSFSTEYPGLTRVVDLGLVGGSSNEIVNVFMAITQNEKLNQPNVEPHYFIAVHELTGKLKKFSALQTHAAISSIGVFENNDILVIAEDMSSHGIGKWRWMIFNDDGEYQRDLFQNDPTIDLEKTTTVNDLMVDRVFSRHGHLVIERHRGNGLIMDEVSQAGLLKESILKLPKPYTAMFAVPSDDANWYVVYSNAESDVTGRYSAEGLFKYSGDDLEIITKITCPNTQKLSGLIKITNGEFLINSNDQKWKPYLQRGTITK